MPHLCIQGWVDRSGVRGDVHGLGRGRGSDLALALRPGWTDLAALKVSGLGEYGCVACDGALPERGARAPHGVQRHRELSGLERVALNLIQIECNPRQASRW